MKLIFAVCYQIDSFKTMMRCKCLNSTLQKYPLPYKVESLFF